MCSSLTCRTGRFAGKSVVILDLDLGPDVEGRRVAERVPSLDALRHDLRWPDGPQAFVIHGAGIGMLDQVTQNVSADLISELLLEHRPRHLSQAKSRNLGLLLEPTECPVELGRNGLLGNLDIEPALRRSELLHIDLGWFHALLCPVEELETFRHPTHQYARGGTRTPNPCGARS